jgi:HEAT repeat protein
MLAFAVAIAPAFSARQQPVQRLAPDALVRQLRDLPSHLYAGPPEWLCASLPCPRPPLPPEETKRLQIYDRLDRLGAAGVKALARGLRSSDVNLRLNVLLALGVLGGGWSLREDGSGVPKIDISAALPALMRALGDSNPNIRASAAFDIGEMGNICCGGGTEIGRVAERRRAGSPRRRLSWA